MECNRRRMSNQKGMAEKSKSDDRRPKTIQNFTTFFTNRLYRFGIRETILYSVQCKSHTYHNVNHLSSARYSLAHIYSCFSLYTIFLPVCTRMFVCGHCTTINYTVLYFTDDVNHHTHKYNEQAPRFS